MRVTSITDVRRQNRGVRVSGQMSSGMHSNYIAPGMPGYNGQRRTTFLFSYNGNRGDQLFDKWR